MASIWSCPNCEGDLRDDLYAQFGLWCPECEQVIPWPALKADDPPEYQHPEDSYERPA